MSASASPGRTWSSRVTKRRLSVLARAPAAAVFCNGYCHNRVSNMDRRQTSAFDGDVGNESHPWNQPGVERIAHCGMDRHNVALSAKSGTAINRPKHNQERRALTVI